MSNDTDIWGQDIALDASTPGIGQALVSAAGELVLTDGPETGIQDIRYRIQTYLGTLFYDGNFGSLVPDWIMDGNTTASRMALEAELVMRIEQDPRVRLGSVSAATLVWDERRVIIQASWEFITEDQPYNLVLQYNKSTKELIINDGSPAEYATEASIQES